MDTTATELEKAKQLSSMVVNLTILPLMASGSSKLPTLHLIATQLLMKLKLQDSWNSLLKSTVQEILQVAKFLEALTADDTMGVDIKTLDDIMRSNAGLRLLVRQSTLQNAVYQKREQALRATHVACQTLGPRLNELQGLMSEKPSSDVAMQILKELPRWRDSLPQGSGWMFVTDPILNQDVSGMLPIVCATTAL